MTANQVKEILESDVVIYTAAIHFNVVKSAAMNLPPKIIYIEDFIDTLTNRILSTFDASILTKKSVMHLAHWYIEGMIREQYSILVNKLD